MVRGKFVLSEIHQSKSGSYVQYKYIFNPVCKDHTEENITFALATPSGKIELVIDNPAAREQFELGGYYYFDATSVNV